MVNKVAQRAIAAGLAGMMSFGAVAPAAMALDTMNSSSWWNWKNVASDEGLTYWKRIAGDDRYGTMKKIVEATYKVGGDNWWNASVAVVASGENFPDALAANGLAGALNGGDGAPVILTKKNSLSSQAKDLLKNMRVQTVYIMGGTSAISAETEQQIKDLKIATVRVAGADRQATSVEAFKLIDGNWFKNHGTHSVIIATGANYADALSIAPFAYKTGTPVVLTKADGTLTDEAVKAIKDNDEIWQVIVVGGTAVVSDSVFSALGTYSGSYKDYYNKVYVPVRIAGADRYDTSAKIADWEINYALDPNMGYWAKAGFSFAETFVATGENFPDALAGGQLAGGKFYANDTYHYNIAYKASSPILLTKDGNRAADSVIASNLAWSWNTVAVDAYNMTYGAFSDYLDDLLGWSITRAVWEDDAHGFFAKDALPDSQTGAYKIKVTKSDGTTKVEVPVYKTSEALLFSDLSKATDDPDYKVAVYAGEYCVNLGDVFGSDATAEQKKTYVLLNASSDIDWVKAADTSITNKVASPAYNLGQSATNPFTEVTNTVFVQDGAWITGYTRTEGNNFSGWIFGGKAAVSKDKAKQLDETVDGAIRKVYDAVGGSEYDSITINGVKYNTLSYLFDNYRNRMSVLGVNSGFDFSDLFYTNQVIVVKKSDYRYLYQPMSFDVKDTAFSTKTGEVTEQVCTVKFAVFDRKASFAESVYDNTYSGYGLTGFKTLKATASLNENTGVWTYTVNSWA